MMREQVAEVVNMVDGEVGRVVPVAENGRVGRMVARIMAEIP